MSNILVGIARWLRHDLELEHTLRIQDLRLIKLGFSHQEVMDMTLEERTSYLEIGSDIEQIDEYQRAFLGVEVSALGGGFTDKKTRKQLYSRWDKGLKKAVKNLEFGVETGLPDDVNVSASKHSPYRKAGVKDYKTILSEFVAKKDGKNLQT